MTAQKKVGRPVGPKGGYDRRIAVYLSAEEENNLNFIQNQLGYTGGTITESVRWAINRAAVSIKSEPFKAVIFPQDISQFNVSDVNDIKSKGDEDIDKTTGR